MDIQILAQETGRDIQEDTANTKVAKATSRLDVKPTISTREYHIIAPNHKRANLLEDLLEKNLLSFARNNALMYNLSESERISDSSKLLLTMSSPSKDFDVLYTEIERKSRLEAAFSPKTRMKMIVQGMPLEFSYMENYLGEINCVISEAREVKYAIVSFCTGEIDSTKHVQQYLHDLSDKRGINIESVRTIDTGGVIRGLLTGKVMPVLSLMRFTQNNGWGMEIKNIGVHFEYMEAEK
ncbi:hypothetical protein FJZ18_00135 [Candidatus Pacearchaeota archaeon]|nr:hypothetical protein [Candidatus Pacearchaeota archaeon]